MLGLSKFEWILIYALVCSGLAHNSNAQRKRLKLINLLVCISYIILKRFLLKATSRFNTTLSDSLFDTNF